MKHLILIFSLLTVPFASFAQADNHAKQTKRPTIVVLPFGESKNRNQVKYLGLATASALTEKLRRVPLVRVLPISSVVHELRSAGIDPYEVSWAPAVATEPLGKWLNADILIIGAIGQIRDRQIAEVVLQASETLTPIKGTQIWLAARAVDIHTGETLRRAYVEGRHENLFSLQHDLLAHIGDLLSLRDHLSLEIVKRAPINNIKSYTQVAEAEQLILNLDQIEDKKREGHLKKAAKRLKWALDKDPESALAHTWRGALLALQNQPTEAAMAFEKAAALDPQRSAPYYGLADLALQKNDMVAAIDALGKIIETTPWDDEAHRLQGKIHQKLGNNSQALAAYKRALDLNPDQHTTYHSVGIIALKQKKNLRAIEALEKATTILPGNIVYHISLADAYLAAKKTDQAKDVLQTIASFAQNDPEYIFVRGKHALLTDRLDDAIGDFKEALIVLHERPDVHTALGTAYVKQSRFADAIETFVDAQTRGATLPDIAQPFGDALEAQNKMAEAEDLYRQALNQVATRSDLRLRLAKHLITRKAHEEAFETLKAGVAIDSNNGHMHILLGDMYAAKNMRSEAIRHYERAIALGHDLPDLAARLGDLHLSQNRPERARTYLRKAINSGINTAAIHASLGSTEETLGNRKAALAAYRQALKANPQNTKARQGIARIAKVMRPKPKTPTHSEYEKQGQRALAMGDLKGAQKALERAVALAPTQATYWNDLGTIYARQNDLSAAETAFQNASGSNSPEPLYNLGRLYADTGRLNDAESVCCEALDIDPNYLPARQQLGAIYMALGHPDRAHSTFQMALEKNPENAELHLAMGNTLFAMHDFQAAQVAYHTARNRGLSAATVGLGAVQLAMGDTAAAMSHFQMAADRNNPLGYINLGAIHTTQGDFETTISDFQQALNISPADANALFGLAALYFQIGQHTDALEVCDILQQRHPNNAEASQLTGTIAFAAQEYELALIAYRSAHNLDENDPETHKGLALTYEALNDPEAAIQHWKHWLELVDNNSKLTNDINRVTQHLKALAELSVVAPNVKGIGLP